MTVDRIGPVDPIHNPKKVKGAGKARQGGGTDSVSFSAEAKSKAEVFHATELAKGAPEVRWDRVQEVKKKLQDPSYISDKVVESVADRLMEHFGIG